MDGTNMSEQLEIIGQDIDCNTGIVRPIYRTPEYDAMLAQAAIEQAAREAEAAAKAEQRAALLERLGITEEEAKLLLGVM